VKTELLDPSLASIDALLGYDALCMLVTEDERPLTGAAGYLDWRMCGSLSRILKSGFFTGQTGERLLTSSEGRVKPERVFAMGLGKRASVTPLGLEHALGNAAGMLKKAHVTSVVLTVGDVPVDVATRADVLRRAFFGQLGEGHHGIFVDSALKARLDD
jgi:hypothetical protein